MLSLLVTALLSNPLWAQSFSSGNQFEAMMLRGEASVICRDMQGRSYHSSEFCSLDILEGGEYDTFVYKKNTGADEVKLEVLQESGKQRSKTKAYNDAKGESKLFNIWVQTLTQRPLLDYGLNKITFTLLKNEKALVSGSFNAVVQDGGTKYCQRRLLTYYNEVNCMNIRARACNDYFSYDNNCR